MIVMGVILMIFHMRTHLMTVMRAFWWKEGRFMWKLIFIIT